MESNSKSVWNTATGDKAKPCYTEALPNHGLRMFYKDPNTA